MNPYLASLSVLADDAPDSEVDGDRTQMFAILISVFYDSDRSLPPKF
jgi:hypothetical protein